MSVRRALRMFAAAIVLLGAAGFGFTLTQPFRDLLRDRLVGGLAGSFRGTVTIGRIEGSIWGDLVLRDVGVRDGEAALLAIPRVRVTYRLWPLLRGEVRVSELEASGAIVRLEQDAGGEWNLLRALSSPAAAPPAESGTSLWLVFESLELRDATIGVTLADGRVVEIHDGALSGNLGVEPAGLAARVDRVAFALRAEGLPPAHAEGKLSYDDTGGAAAIRIAAFEVATDRSRAALTGTLHDLAKPEIEALLRLAPLSAADVNAVAPGTALHEDVGGTLAVKGPLARLAAHLDLSAGEAKVKGEIRADARADAPSLDADIDVTTLDLGKVFAREGLAGVINAKVRARGTTSAPADAEAEATVGVEGLTVAGARLDSARLQVRMSGGTATLQATVRAAQGHAEITGNADLSAGKAWKVALDAAHWNPRAVVPAPEVPTGDVSLRWSAQGSGFDPATLRATTRLDVLPSTVGAVRLRGGGVVAGFAQQRLELTRATLEATGAKAELHGEAGFQPGADTRLDGSATISDLTPWLALAGRQGAGTLSLSGRASGRLSDLALDARVAAKSLRLDTARLEQGEATVAVRGVGQPAQSGRVDLSLAELTAGVHVAAASAAADLSAATGGAVGAENRTHTLELPGGTWRLAGPATVRQAAGQLTIEHFALTNGPGRVAITGTASTAGRQDLSLQIERLPLAILEPLLPPDAKIAGSLHAKVVLGGTATAPVVTTEAGIDPLQIAGQSYESLSARARVGDGRATASLDFRQDATHSLGASAGLPFALRWAPDWRAEPAGDLDFRARSAGLSLAFLEVFGGQTARQISGELALDLTLRGALSRPLARGTVSLRDGAASVLPLNVRWEAIGAEIVLSPEEARLTRLTAHAGDGTLDASGALALDESGLRGMTAAITLERWPVIDTRRAQADVAGRVTVEGALDGLRAGGRIEVLRALLRPDLAFLREQPAPPDPTITVLGEAAAAGLEGSAPGGPAAPALGQEQIQRGLATDLTVSIARNAWIKTDEAAVELRGEIRAIKRPGESLTLAGAIETARGWARFQDRRFTITRGNIQLTGGEEIDPLLDVVARYKVSNYVVEAVVGGQASKPTLTLRSDPTLEQADILSLLAFGKPAKELSSGEQVSLQKKAQSLAASYAVSEVSSSVTAALGVEELGIQVEELSAERVAVGSYVTEKTYVSVSQDFAEGQGREVSIEYEVVPNWSVVTSTNTAGNSGADVIWRKRY